MNIVKYKELILEHWIPVSITGILAIIAAISLSVFNAEVSDNRFFLEKQAETAERVTKGFSSYIENMRRISALKEYVARSSLKPTDQDINQLREYIKIRSKSRDDLFSALDALSLYYDEKTSKVAYDFRNWDEEQSLKVASDLPSIHEWQMKQRSILLLMRQGLMQ